MRGEKRGRGTAVFPGAEHDLPRKIRPATRVLLAVAFTVQKELHRLEKNTLRGLANQDGRHLRKGSGDRLCNRWAESAVFLDLKNGVR